MRIVGRLLLPCSLFVLAAMACAPAAPALNQDGVATADGLGEVTGDDSTPSDPPSTQSTRTSLPVSEAGAADASASADAARDAQPGTLPPPPPRLPTGSTCTVASQCAGNYCLPYQNKGLRCTQACTRDSDCPSNSCNNTPSVCDI